MRVGRGKPLDHQTVHGQAVPCKDSPCTQQVCRHKRHLSKVDPTCNLQPAWVQVVDCADWSEYVDPATGEGLREEKFFDGLNGRLHPAEAPMLKLRDWPPAGEFKNELPRHNTVRPCCGPAC